MKCCFSFFILLLLCSLSVAQDLKPYRNEKEVLKDLQDNMKIASQIRLTNKADKKHYELLGKAFTLHGIICRRSEITQFPIVQRAFEMLQKNYNHAQNDYIIFTDNCRNLYGVYR